jgi:hypothetical protein
VSCGIIRGTKFVDDHRSLGAGVSRRRSGAADRRRGCRRGLFRAGPCPHITGDTVYVTAGAHATDRDVALLQQTPRQRRGKTEWVEMADRRIAHDELGCSREREEFGILTRPAHGARVFVDLGDGRG